MADLPPADPCATRRAMDRLLPRPQADVLNAAAEQIIDNVLAQIEADNRQDLARVTAREQLVRRVNMFTEGLRQIGFTAIIKNITLSMFIRIQSTRIYVDVWV